MSESNKTELPNGPFLLRSAPTAMLRLALGSACTIATLLCIPDGAAILPDTENFGVWLVRITGLWLSAYFLWTLGFLAILYLVRTLTRGIELKDDGFKLWRFGRLVKWDCVRAISCEAQPFFSKAFCLTPVVHRLIIYCAKPSKSVGKPEKIVPHSIPSFQFTAEEFQSLLVFVSERCFGIQPSGAHLLLIDDSAKGQLKKSYEQGRTLRVAMSAFILISLVAFLSRRAVVNFNFNKANHEYRQERYQAALTYYRTATTFDPTFAPAWDRLARTEYRLNLVDEAEKDWLKAIQMKPDFVESKIGLATISLKKHEYSKARQLLTSALRLSPTSIAAYLSLSDLYIREYQYTSAIDILRQLVESNESNGRARGLLARAYLRSGQIEEAKHQLESKTKHKPDSVSDTAFLSLVAAEVAIADGHVDNAELSLKRLSAPFKNGVIPDDLLLDWIALRSVQSDDLAVENLVRSAKKRGIPKDEIEAARRVVALRSPTHE